MSSISLRSWTYPSVAPQSSTHSSSISIDGVVGALTVSMEMLPVLGQRLAFVLCRERAVATRICQIDTANLHTSDRLQQRWLRSCSSNFALTFCQLRLTDLTLLLPPSPPNSIMFSSGFGLPENHRFWSAFSLDSATTHVSRPAASLRAICLRFRLLRDR